MPSAYALIADTDAKRADAVSRCLTDRKLTPVIVRDGEQARARLMRDDVPTLLVTNLSLPLVDGFQLLRQLRSLARPHEAAAIAISAFSILSEVAQRLRDELGITTMLAAGATGDEISAAVRHALESVAPPAAGPERLQDGVVRAALELPSASGDDARWEGAARSLAQQFRAALAVIARATDDHSIRVHLSASASFDTEVPADPDSWWQVIVSGRPCLIKDVLREPDGGARDLTGRVMRGFQAVPLLVDGRITGAVALVHPHPIHDASGSIDLLATAAAKLASPPQRPVQHDDEGVGVEAHGRYVESLWRMALTDPLTGMNNRRGAEDAMQREIGRSRRMNSALSVAMFDIDSFKALNDKYGHAAGDTVLRDVSNVLRTAARVSDLAARWGGEEFLVILPDVSLDGAVRFAERVRSRIEQLTFPQGFSVTISAGIAQYRPGEAVHLFLERADEHLYRAKAEGRNRVSAESPSSR